MLSPPRVLVCFAGGDAEGQAAASLLAGFEREGVAAERADGLQGLHGLLVQARAGDVAVVSAALALEDALGDLTGTTVIAVGDAERRAAVVAAGATAYFERPAFVKDVVTLGRVFTMPRDGIEPGWGGDLDGLHLYYIVRALWASRKSGVLGLLRGGRRGEVRFFEGELTSAQVGALHGQAAFHQLLLWPDARFDLRAETVVRRQQIPLTPAWVLKDAERFLRDFHDLSDGVTPAATFEQEPARAAETFAAIPQEVREVMRLFDGERTVADVIEESPLRLTETLKVMGRLVALGALRRVAGTGKGEATAALLVEDWQVGESAPPPREGERPRRRKGDTPAGGALAADWGSLGVAGMGSSAWEAASYAPVVPSQTATGEISAAAAMPALALHEGAAKTVGGNGNKGKRVGTASGPALAIAAAVAPLEPVKDKKRSTAELRSVPRERPFDDHEEAFFDEEQRYTAAHSNPPPVESFDDLDDGQKPLGFWQRLFQRYRKQPRRRRR